MLIAGTRSTPWSGSRGRTARSLRQSVYNITAFNPSAEEIRSLVIGRLPRRPKSPSNPISRRQVIVDSWPADVDDSAARADWGLAPRATIFESGFADHLIPRIRGPLPKPEPGSGRALEGLFEIGCQIGPFRKTVCKPASRASPLRSCFSRKKYLSQRIWVEGGAPEVTHQYTLPRPKKTAPRPQDVVLTRVGGPIYSGTESSALDSANRCFLRGDTRGSYLRRNRGRFPEGRGHNMKVTRRFTRADKDPYETIEFRRTILGDPKPRRHPPYFRYGRESRSPESWSQVAVDVLVQKYFRKAGVPQVDRRRHTRGLREWRTPHRTRAQRAPGLRSPCRVLDPLGQRARLLRLRRGR